MAASTSVGQLATLTTVDDKTYKGILYSIDDKVGKIVLKNVYIDNMRLAGLHNFYASNVKELNLSVESQDLDLVNKAKEESTKLKRGQRRIQYRKDRPRHLDKLLKFDSDDLIRAKCNCSGYESGDQGIGSSTEEQENYEDFYQTDNFILFCRTCEKFRDSIIYVLKQDHVAVTFFGVDICRDGALSLMQIATEDSIIMYDIVRLGLEGFIDGLQAVLESDTLTKVIHDCRMVSDLLFHQYGIVLSNVFDTQVAGAFVMRYSNGGDWPRFVDSLPVALQTHLGLKNEDVHHFFVRENLKKRDEEIWLQRPLCAKLLKDTLKNIVHILPLYHTLQDKMMLEFNIGTQLCLSHVRDAPQDHVERHRTSSYLLPPIFQQLPQLAAQTARQVTSYKRRLKTSYDSNGFVDVCQSTGNPAVTASRDSIWHTTKHFTPVSKCETNNVETYRCDNSRSGAGVQETLPSTSSRLSCDETSQSSGRRQDMPTENCLRGKDSSPNPAEINSLVSNLQSLSPPSAEFSTTLLHQPKDRPVVSTHISQCQGAQPTTEKSSPAYSEPLTGIERSALFRLSQPSCSPASSDCAEIFSDPEIVELGLKTEINQDDWDCDKVLEFEMAQKIIKRARQGHSRSETKKRLLPSKVKILPKPGSGC